MGLPAIFRINLRHRSTFKSDGSINGTGNEVVAASVIVGTGIAFDFAMPFAFRVDDILPSFVGVGVSVGEFVTEGWPFNGTCGGSPDTFRQTWERPPRQLQPTTVRWSSPQQVQALALDASVTGDIRSATASSRLRPTRHTCDLPPKHEQPLICLPPWPQHRHCVTEPTKVGSGVVLDIRARTRFSVTAALSQRGYGYVWF
jgi:hypothetical protein